MKLIKTKPLTEEEQIDIDKGFEQYLQSCPVIPSRIDSKTGALVISKEEWDDWD